MGRRAQSEEFHFEGFEYPTTTPVPDVIFDAFLSRLGEAELKALLYIVRRTFGFKKDRDAISFNQFLRGIKTREGQVLDEGCGVKDRTTLSRALQSLEAKGIIRCEKGIDARGENETSVYSLRFKGDTPPVVAASSPAPEVVGNSYHAAPATATGRGGVVGNSYQGGRENPAEVVGIPYHRSRENPRGVVGIPYPQQTVIQETEGQGNSNIRKGPPFFLDVDNFVDNFVDNGETVADPFASEPSEDFRQPDVTAICETDNVPAPSSFAATEVPHELPPTPDHHDRSSMTVPTGEDGSRTASPTPDGERKARRGAAMGHAQASLAGFPGGDSPTDVPVGRREGETASSLAVQAWTLELPGAPRAPIITVPDGLAAPTTVPEPPPSGSPRRAIRRIAPDTPPVATGAVAAMPPDHEVPYDAARDQLMRFVEDFAREFNDQAPLRSTLSRLANLYQRSALPMDIFVGHLYAARQTTQERTGSIRTRAGEGSTKNKMVYFFGVLENRLGFRDHAESSDLAAMFARSGS